MKKILLAAHREEFVTTVTEKLLTYALGRGMESYDAPAVRAIMRETAKDNHRLPALIGAVINSTPFQMRQASKNTISTQRVKGTKGQRLDPGDRP